MTVGLHYLNQVLHTLSHGLALHLSLRPLISPGSREAIKKAIALACEWNRLGVCGQ